MQFYNDHPFTRTGVYIIAVLKIDAYMTEFLPS